MSLVKFVAATANYGTPVPPPCLNHLVSLARLSGEGESNTHNYVYYIHYLCKLTGFLNSIILYRLHVLSMLLPNAHPV